MNIIIEVINFFKHINLSWLEYWFFHGVEYLSISTGMTPNASFRMMIALIAVGFNLVIALSIILLRKLYWLLMNAIALPFKFIFSYPMTEFGFRGKLVYSDDSPTAKVFVSHGYKLSAKPDFIFKIGFNQYVIVEFKSRQGAIKHSDLVQLLATAIAVRSKYRVVRGYIVTANKTKAVGFGTNRQIYRQIKDTHKIVKKIKHTNYFPPKKCDANCQNCGHIEVCEKDTKYKMVEGV